MNIRCDDLSRTLYRFVPWNVNHFSTRCMLDCVSLRSSRVYVLDLINFITLDDGGVFHLLLLYHVNHTILQTLRRTRRRALSI